MSTNMIVTHSYEIQIESVINNYYKQNTFSLKVCICIVINTAIIYNAIVLCYSRN